MHLQPIPAPMVEANWDRVARYVADACIKGPMGATVEEFYKGLLDRDYQMWIIEDEAGSAKGVFITSIYGGVCEWSAVGGVDFAKWKHLETIIEDWARQNKCRAMRSYSRMGMVKRLPDYTIKGVLLEKAL